MSITTVTFSSRQEAAALKAAARKGAKRLGSGAFAVAYLKGGRNPVVIKIGRMGDAYIEYAKKVIQSKSKNPFLPKIHSLTLYKADPRASGEFGLDYQEFYVVKMEKLYDLQDKHKDNVGRICDMFEQLVEYNYSVDKWMRSNDWSSFCVPGMMEFNFSVNKKAMLWLKDARKVVMRALRAADCGGWDIHGGNIMVRKNGQLVLTDPIA